jgi:hypothetical protein
MRKKLRITESQLKTVVKLIKENEQFKHILKKITDDLILNYEQVVGTVNNGVEFTQKELVTKKVDGTQLTLGALLNYMSAKYTEVTPEFIKQVITDWYNGVLDGKNYKLSKNVKLG